MEEFINVKDAKKKHKINYDKVDEFIKIMNQSIKKRKYGINNSLDKFTALNDEEFEVAQARANKAGWTLSWFDDNHDTVSYKIFPTDRD